MHAFIHVTRGLKMSHVKKVRFEPFFERMYMNMQCVYFQASYSRSQQHGRPVLLERFYLCSEGHYWGVIKKGSSVLPLRVL